MDCPIALLIVAIYPMIVLLIVIFACTGVKSAVITGLVGKYNPYKLFVGAFLPNWILERTEISQGAKLTFARLAQYAGQNGVAFPKQSTLAAALGVSERHVHSYLKELINHNLIAVERKGLGQANRYTFITHPWMSDRKKASDQEPKKTSDHLKRIIEENHQDENQRLDNILYSPGKLKRAVQGIRAATALNFGHLSE